MDKGEIICTVLLGILIIIAVVAFVSWLRRRRYIDILREQTSAELLQMANMTLDFVKDGMTPDAAMSVCKMLLPATDAIAVSITNKTTIIAYLGYYGSEKDPTGGPILTSATRDTINDGKVRVLRTKDDIGFPKSVVTKIEAAIIVPFIVGSPNTTTEAEGTLKLYYEEARQVTATQVTIAKGIARLLSTQITALEMENQRDIATAMELKMLQSQINPHFLFNTINTIASLVRTDPDKARTLLRDFAAFYRSTLADPSEHIRLSDEVRQTLRYFSLVVARFGNDRVAIHVDLDPMIEDLSVPPFFLQPIIENSVTHGMPSEGKLTINLTGRVRSHDVIIEIDDNGVGMDVERYKQEVQNRTGSAHGLALKNVQDRLSGDFGPGSTLTITSEPGHGTDVTLLLKDALEDQIPRTATELKAAKPLPKLIPGKHDEKSGGA